MTLPPNPINISCGKAQRKVKGYYPLDPTTFSNNITIFHANRMTSYTQSLLLLPPSPPSSPPQAQTQPQSLRGWDNQFHGKNVVFNISFKIFSTLLFAVFKRIIHAQNSTRYDITLLLEIMNLHKTLITGKQQCSSLDKKFATNICNMPVFIHSKFAENHLVYSLISRRQPTRVKSIVYELKLENNEKRPVADKY